MVERCSRHKESGHTTRGCREPWPFWKQQECDRCGGDHETGAKKLCKDPAHIISCKHCGHEKDHNSQICPIKDKTEKNIRQYTKTLYMKAIDSDEVKLSLATSRLASNRIQAPRERSGLSFADVRKIMKDAQVKVAGKHLAPAVTAEQQEEYTCGKANLDIAPYAPSRLATGPEILANSFKIAFLKNNNLDIRKYDIELGSLWDDDGNQQVGDGSKKAEIPLKKTDRSPKKETVRAVIEDLLLDQFEPSTTWASDFRSHIISVGRLYPGMPHNQAVGECYEVDHYRKGKQDDDYQLVTSRIVYRGKLQAENLSQYVSATGSRPNNYLPDDDLRILNLIIWKEISLPSFQGARLGTKFFPNNQHEDHQGTVYLDPKSQKSPLYHLRTGYFSSVRPGHGQLLLNVNTAMSAFLLPINLQTWINNRWPTKKGEKAPSSKKLSKELVGVRVTFKGDDLINGHNGMARKTRVIRSFSDDTVELTKFPVRFTEDSEEIVEVLVFTHWKNKYPALVKETTKNAVCVNLGGKTPMWYPADSLTIADWQMIKLDSNLADQMVTKAQKFPVANKMLIEKYALPLLCIGQQKSFHKDFGIEISSNFLKFKARIVSIPQLNFHGDSIGGKTRTKFAKSGSVDTPASWNLKDVAGFYEIKAATEKLAILRICTSLDKTVLNGLKTNFFQKLPELEKYGLLFKNVEVVEVLFPKAGGRAELKKVLDKAWQQLSGPPFVLVQLPYKDPIIYANLKWWGDCDQGVATSCILAAKCAKISGSLIGNLDLKINAKTGGTNHHILDIGVKGNTMIVGADVTHPGKGTDVTCPSIAGIVATHDPRYVQYLGSARLQTNKNEHIEDLQGMMIERLMVFYQKNGIYPEHILFYRDGVSESQYGMVKTRELPQITKAISEIRRIFSDGRQFNPKITLLIVGKRHHMRFYPEKVEEDAKSLGPGRVMDTDVIIPHAFNFYLQSHNSLLGTARVSHYVVLVDGSGYGGADLQKVTNDLCSLGSRATHALSVCTPARYADLLCDRLRLYMKPIMDGTNDIPEGDALTVLNIYKRDKNFWGTTRNRGKVSNPNPWNDKVKDVMFYL